MRSIGILLVFAGCNVGSAAQPDATDEPGDGAPHSLGMFVRWRASPTLPGSLNDKIVVSEATFQLDHFQIIADAGSVTRSKYLLAWDDRAAPPQEAFPDAPPGVYSKITLNMMGGSFGDYAYRIRGTWRDNGVSKPFEIRDPVQLSTSFNCNQILLAAGSATIGIDVDLRDAVGQIDFKNVDVEDGVLELHDGAQLASFRDRLLQAFTLDN
jgi:hypothetical protein